jgi:hypothetical protein
MVLKSPTQAMGTLLEPCQAVGLGVGQAVGPLAPFASSVVWAARPVAIV